MKNHKIYDVENPLIILKNLLVNFFSTSATKIIGILLVPVYTNYLSTNDYGLLELMMILSNFLLLLFPIGLKSAGGRLYFAYIEKKGLVKEGLEIKVFISQNIFLITISTVFQICIFLLIGDIFWDKNYLGINYSPFISTIILASGLRVYYPIVLKLIQSRGDSIRLAQFTIIYSLLGVFLNIFFIVVLDFGLLGFLYAYITAGLVLFILTLLYLKNDLIFSINTKMIKESISYSSPLLLSSLFAFSYSFADRFIISFSRTNSEVGVYSLAAKYAILLSLIHVAITRVLNPYFYSKLSKQNTEIKSLILTSKYNIIVFIVIGLIMALFSQDLINVIAPDSYSKAGIIAPILILGYVIQSFYFNSTRILSFFKKTKIIAMSSIVVGGLSFLLNVLLIPRFGSVAAASVFVFSILLHSLILYYFAQKTFRLDYNYSGLVVLIIVLIIIISFLAFLPIESYIYLFSIKLVLVFVTLSFIFFKYFGIKQTKQAILKIKNMLN
jgi:O-antigen/teichoic acid export membrane protein